MPITPEMMFRAALVVPPITLNCAPCVTWTPAKAMPFAPFPLATAAVPGLPDALALAGTDGIPGAGPAAGSGVGTGAGASVQEVISAVEEVTGKRVPHRKVPRRPGDPPILVANPAKAQALLQWKATRGLRDVVATAWNWMERQRGAAAK